MKASKLKNITNGYTSYIRQYDFKKGTCHVVPGKPPFLDDSKKYLKLGHADSIDAAIELTEFYRTVIEDMNQEEYIKFITKLKEDLENE